MNICFIGFGNMAKAIAQGLKNEKNLTIHACAPSLDEGGNVDGIITHSDNNAVLADMDVVILGVKPHQVKSVLPALTLPARCTLVSIAAGVTLDQLAKLAPDNQAIVRTMPNTPLAVGYGATQLIANEQCTHKHKTAVETLFHNSGIFIWVDSEAMIDCYTGLSGSGPAYIFYILEGLIEGARSMGIDETNARKYAQQTMLGALKLSMASEVSPETLRKQVTSPGGATAEAISVFDAHDVKQIIEKAMKASRNKAQQLKESAQ